MGPQRRRTPFDLQHLGQDCPYYSQNMPTKHPCAAIICQLCPLIRLAHTCTVMTSFWLILLICSQFHNLIIAVDWIFGVCTQIPEIWQSNASVSSHMQLTYKEVHIELGVRNLQSPVSPGSGVRNIISAALAKKCPTLNHTIYELPIEC